MADAEGVGVFISYSAKDRAAAETLALSLEQLGMVVFAFKYTPLTPSVDFIQRLHYAISVSPFFVVLLSSHSSRFIDTEIGAAQSLKRVIIPVLLTEDAEPPPTLATMHAICAYEDPNWVFQVSGFISRLLRSVQTLPAEPPPSGLKRAWSTLMGVSNSPWTKGAATVAGLAALVATAMLGGQADDTQNSQDDNKA